MNMCLTYLVDTTIGLRHCNARSLRQRWTFLWDATSDRSQVTKEENDMMMMVSHPVCERGMMFKYSELRMIYVSMQVRRIVFSHLYLGNHTMLQLMVSILRLSGHPFGPEWMPLILMGTMPGGQWFTMSLSFHLFQFAHAMIRSSKFGAIGCRAIHQTV